jgi:spore photoproduct lyase
VTAWRPDEVWIERAELNSALAETVLSRIDGGRVQVIDGPVAADVRTFAAGKRTLLLQRHRGSFLQACPAGTNGLVCCNYMVVNFGSNCPFDCSYCFLQEYLAHNATMKVFTNVEDGLAEIAGVLRAHPQRRFRIGTGELADSLALDPITGLSPRLVTFFAQYENALLELKTKSDEVAALLRVDPRGRTVVSWSVNAREIIDAEEHGTASLDQRVDAARRVQRAGYRIGFHFDPLVEFDGWEAAYARAIETIFSAVDVAGVAWVSLGALRLTPALATIVRARAARSYTTAAELVPGPDGKARVWRGLRLRMYRSLLCNLRRVSQTMPVYLCMEPPAVWERVMRDVPLDRHLGMRLSAPPPW